MAEYTDSVKPYPLGAHIEKEGIRFSFVSEKDSCGVVLYDRVTGKQLRREAFDREEKIGRVYCKYLADVDAARISYLFYEEDRLIPDYHARAFAGQFAFGKRRDFAALKAVIPTEDYDWQGDRKPKLSMQDSLCYCIHVRGFTAHVSSGVKNRGSFDGIREKIPYLKEIGVTTIELQPAYEFTEISAKEEVSDRENGVPREMREEFPEKEEKLNYWGYKRGFYYAPKAAYSHSGDAVSDFKDLVRELHQNGMELVMQFYFPESVKVLEIPELLRFWALEYHVDGFHLMGVNLPVDMIATDDVLADTKLWYYRFSTDALYQRDEVPAFRNLAFYSDEYLYTLRRFLKGDEGMQESALFQMRHIPEKAARVHYLTNYEGFTLADMVSYDHKHNEANGEDNRDGNDYNCSWNCGEEGPSRKGKVRALRLRQMKNAMCMLMLSQSTPLIFMGDEFGNSQKGNNNPYCQDNRIAWLDWTQRNKNAEIFAFWKGLVSLRRNHAVLHPASEPRMMDYISCGYPDLSYHGQSAWRPQTEYYSRHVGMMFCGKYAEREGESEDDFLYIAMNMHWEEHELALPKLPKGMKWIRLLTTAQETRQEDMEEQADTNAACVLGARSIAVYRSAKEKSIVKKSGKSKKIR